MTRPLYHLPEQPLQFSATVTAHDGTDIALEATAFYPESGGQSSDTGWLRWDGGAARVTHARKDKATGHIWHRLEGALPPLGSEVRGEVEAGPRWRHSQRHSAEHLFAQAMRRINPVFEVASVNMTSPECTIDFVGDPDDIYLLAAEKLLRETLGRGNLVLETPLVPEAELGRYPLRRESKVGGEVRLVIFRDGDEFFDVSACGGTHVPRAAMCAPVVVLRSERVRGGQTRVVFMAGEEASEYLAGVYRQTRTLAQDFSAPLEKLPERVAALRQEGAATLAQAEALRKQLAAHLVAGAAVRGGLRLLRLDDPALLQPVLSAVPAGEIVAAVAAGGRCGIGSRRPLHQAGDLLRAALAETGGKGGGKPDLAQGSTNDEAGFLSAVERVLETAGR